MTDGFRLVAWGTGAAPSRAPRGYNAWIDGASQLTVVVGGSGSCPWLPDTITVPSAAEVHIHIHSRRAGEMCTSDFVSQYFVVQLPRAIAAKGRLTLALRYGRPLNRTRLLRIGRA